MSRTIYDTLEGIKNIEPKAQGELYMLVNNGKSFSIIRKRGFGKMEAEDIFFDAFEILERKIKGGQFVLKLGLQEEKAKNTVLKYFYAQITGCITSIRRDKTYAVTTINEQVVSTISFDIEKLDQLGLIGQTMRLIKNIGPICKEVLTYSLVHNLSNKEIAKLAIHPELDKTPKVTERRTSCLKKLYDNLVNHLSIINEGVKADYLKVAFQTISSIDEPCKTILQSHFGGLNNEDIATRLQTLTNIKVENLKTADQVKKKKTRCLESYRVMIMQQILNPKK